MSLRGSNPWSVSCSTFGRAGHAPDFLVSVGYSVIPVCPSALKWSWKVSHEGKGGRKLTVWGFMCWFLLPYVALSHSTWGAWDVSSTNILDLHPSISHKILCCTPIVPPPCQSWACKWKWTKMLNGNIWCWNRLIFMGMKYMSRKASEIQTPKFLSLLETHKLAKKKKN